MTIGKNFCIAPFTQITYGPLNSASPCAYLGGEAWQFEPDAKLSEIWLSTKYELLRQSFLKNNKNYTCNRCWREEEHGKQSSRKITLVSFPYKNNMLDCVNGNYKLGPRQINLRVGNICNLRCRSCNSQSSVTYAVEGQHYETSNDLPKTAYTRYNKPFEFSKEQIDDIFDMRHNLRRIEFYGGEPLVDKPTLDLLEKLAACGKSKEITLFYNTNGITKPTPRHIDIWQHFERVDFHFSVDAIRDQFSYVRHPGRYEELLDNIDFLKNQLSEKINVPVNCGIICTVQTLNIFYLPEILQEFDRLGIKHFLNLVTNPRYYDIRNIPAPAKQAIIERLMLLPPKSEISSIISILKSDQDPRAWQEFVFWTKQKDAYRKEDFSKTFPEFFELVKEYYV
jgi:MoaA/NifB/PqqE/SkfB family radical SAM enzyme